MSTFDRTAWTAAVSAGVRWALVVVVPLVLIACGGKGGGSGGY